MSNHVSHDNKQPRPLGLFAHSPHINLLHTESYNNIKHNEANDVDNWSE